MHVPFNRDLPSPLSGLCSYNLREKRSIWNKLLVKEHIVCRSVSGPSTVRWCQSDIGPIICRVASPPEGRWRQPPAGRYTVMRWAAGGPIYICWLGWLVKIRSRVLSFRVGKSTSCSKLISAVISRKVLLTLAGYWEPEIFSWFKSMSEVSPEDNNWLLSTCSKRTDIIHRTGQVLTVRSIGWSVVRCYGYSKRTSCGSSTYHCYVSTLFGVL